jgi:hypothetical protein
MTTYEIRVDGQHAATVSVRDDREIFAYVAQIRRQWQEPVVEIDADTGEVFEWYPDPDEFGGVEITSRIVRQR